MGGNNMKITTGLLGYAQEVLHTMTNEEIQKRSKKTRDKFSKIDSIDDDWSFLDD